MIKNENLLNSVGRFDWKKAGGCHLTSLLLWVVTNAFFVFYFSFVVGIPILRMIFSFPIFIRSQ